MRVAGAQLDIVWEEPRANLERVDRLVQAAAERGAELVALPEMFATGFTMAAVEMAAHADAIRAHLVELAAAKRELKGV